MDRIKLKKEDDIIEYVIAHATECQERKIFTNKKMVDRLTENVDKSDMLTRGKCLILASDTNDGNVVVEFVREGSDCYWLKDIVVNGKALLGKVDSEKEPIHIANEEVKTFII